MDKKGREDFLSWELNFFCQYIVAKVESDGLTICYNDQILVITIKKPFDSKLSELEFFVFSKMVSALMIKIVF